MTRISSVDHSEKLLTKEDLNLPSFVNYLESVLSKGDSLQVDGTNVVRVPFGVRQPRKQRPARRSNWATLVLPIQSTDTPTPPPHAA